jgi:flagellar hook protein FlgE
MFSSFSTALSALNADATAIDVVGNNLANLNTTSFKTNVIAFHDLVTQSLGAGLGETQVGFGVGRPTTLRQFTQGSLQTTSGSLDAAIQGDGFFVVNSNGTTEYTRAGNFQIDHDGFLVTATGEKVQGWTQSNGVLNTNAPAANMEIPVGSISAPVATQSMSFDLNLNAGATAGPPPDAFSTSIKIYDSLGQSHVLTANFTKNANAGQWDYSITVPDADLKSPFTAVTGSLTFDANGRLLTPAATDPSPQVQIQGFSDGASDATINWNLYNGTTPRITQFTQTSAVSAVAQDGAEASQLIRVAIADGGQVLAQYSNGKELEVGQLAMATIRNPDSLIAAGNNNYQVSGETALPAIGVSGTGGRGTIAGGSLEASTVDIATEFTNLIVFQRGYQANSKVVTTADQLSQDTIALKQ